MSHVRIASHAPPGTKTKGQHVNVYFVDDEGVEHTMSNVRAVSFSVDSRGEYAEVGLVISGVEVCVEGVLSKEASEELKLGVSAAEATLRLVGTR